MDELMRWLEKHSQTELASKVGVTQGAVSQWLQLGYVPHKKVRAVQRATKIAAGKLNPDFARQLVS